MYLREKRTDERGVKTMKSIAFLNIKGGVGKTTSVTTIGHMLAAQYGKRVLIVDLDPQGNSTALFSENRFFDDFSELENVLLDYSVSNLMLDRKMDVRKCIIHTRYENLDIIGADLQLTAVERTVTADTSTPQQIRLQKHLAKIQDEYDYCLFDCSPNSGLINVNGLTMADEVYIPICADGYSLQGIKSTEELIENVADFNEKLKIAAIYCTRWENKNVNEVAYQFVEAKYPDLLIPIKINKSKLCEENTMWREPLLAVDSGENKSKATQAYLQLTEYILAPNKKEFLKTLKEI